MFRSTGNFDKLLDKATSNYLLDPDWPSILQICDLIRQNDCNPKYAVLSIKKKLSSPNPHQAMFALLVLESIVKNCGSGVHDEITSKANCEYFRELVKSSQHENVRNKMLELIQAWAFAFRNTPKYRTVQDTVNIMKAEGYKFPALKESDAMFSADCAPEWSDGDVCHRCRVLFSLMQRKHHCRACGQVFCQQCSSKNTTLPKFGIEKEVRVCDACYDQITRPNSGTSSSKSESSDHSSEYGGSAHTTTQKPAQKSAEELQEEEELQLALALSQSEAEQKEKERQRSAPPAVVHSTPSPVHLPVHGSPPGSAPPAELSRYLDRGYWEQRSQPGTTTLQEPPSAPQPSPQPQQPPNNNEIMVSKISGMKLENGSTTDTEMEEFIAALKSQVEIFVNRMKSNSSRGRSIANDSSVQTLFMNITTMHSRLLRYIQQQDDSRVHFEALQDKLSQVKDSRAALDVLREEHAERLRRAAEQAERQRQLQMAHKLDIMRKKKQEYLQYQRQLALQRVQEQEREMQMRQEQQKHQYMMGNAPNPYYMQGSPVHQFQQAGGYQQPGGFPQGYMMGTMRQPMGHPMVMGQQMVMGQMPGNQMPMPGGQQNQQMPMQQPMVNQQPNQPGQPMPPHGQLPPHLQHQMGAGMPGQMPQQLGQTRPQMPPGSQVPATNTTVAGMNNQGQPMYQGMPQPGQGIPPTSQGMPPAGQGMQPPGQGMAPPGPGMQPPGPGMQPPGPGMQPPGPGMQPPGQGMPLHGQGMPPNQGIPATGQGMPQPGQGMPQPGQGMPPPGQGMPQPGQGMPPPGQGVPQPGQGMPPPGQGMPPPGQGMPPEQGGMPQGHQIPPGMQHMGQNQMPPQMMPPNQSPIPQMGQPGPDSNKLGAMSPTSGAPPNMQAPPIGITGQQNSQGSPQQTKPIIVENKTAELISFD